MLARYRVVLLNAPAVYFKEMIALLLLEKRRIGRPRIVTDTTSTDTLVAAVGSEQLQVAFEQNAEKELDRIIREEISARTIPESDAAACNSEPDVHNRFLKGLFVRLILEREFYQYKNDLVLLKLPEHTNIQRVTGSTRLAHAFKQYNDGLECVKAWNHRIMWGKTAENAHLDHDSIPNYFELQAEFIRVLSSELENLSAYISRYYNP